MRLIDADHLRRWILSRVFKTQLSIADVIDQIDREDTIKLRCEECEAFNKTRLLVPQPEKRKKGKWIHGKELCREMMGNVVTKISYDGWKCSVCDCLVEDERKPLWNFCPNCGANMRGEGNDET